MRATWLGGYGAIAAASFASSPHSLLAAQGAGGVGGVKVAGYVQPRFEAIGDSALFFLRRVRLGAQSDLTPWARVKAQVDLRYLGTNGSNSTVVGTDLYVVLTGARAAVTLGQAKVPFSTEELLSSGGLPLPDRSVVVGDYAPNRDIGAQVDWRPTGGGPLELEGGVFDGEGPNHAANPDKKMLYVGRAAVSPVTSAELSGGVAAYPDSTWWDAGATTHHGAWLVRAEWLRRSRRGTSNQLRGWYALATYTVRRDRVQLVGRVEQFDSTSAPADRETGYTAGAQDFFKGEDLKLQASYAVFTEAGPTAPPVGKNRLVVQLQARF